MESSETSAGPTNQQKHRLQVGIERRRIKLFIAMAVMTVAAASVFASSCGDDRESTVAVGGTAGSEDTITVTGKATVQAAPDEAILTIAVENQAPEPAAALDANSAATAQVIERLNTEGVEDQAIETTNVAVYPIRSYDPETGKETLTGYRAQNSVTVTIKDPATVGRVLAASVESGATNISGPIWRLSEDSTAANDALGQAVANARARAEALAAAAGVDLGDVLMMSEASIDQPSPLVYADVRAAGEDAVAEPPISPGTLDISATVTVSYELEH
jgi:uncharacterized protein YggE